MLEAIYARIPDARCKGLCTKSCSVIAMTVHEARRLRQAGTPLPPHDVALARVYADAGYRCPALVDGRCSVYELRPFVCRIYGSSESLPCPFGCEPDEGLLSADETLELFTAVEDAGGGTR